MMLTHYGNNVRNRYSGCVFSVKDIVPVPLKTSRNLYLRKAYFSQKCSTHLFSIRGTAESRRAGMGNSAS